MLQRISSNNCCRKCLIIITLSNYSIIKLISSAQTFLSQNGWHYKQGKTNIAKNARWTVLFLPKFLQMPQFSCLPFPELSNYQLYEILALRIEVFCVEQNCPYQDCDGKDFDSLHLMGRDKAGKLTCYTRLLPLGLVYPDYVSIGRVVTAPSARGMGTGKILMVKSIELCQQFFGNQPIKIGAQTYLLRFYEGFGFQSTGEEYLEDGIPHTKMVRHA